MIMKKLNSFFVGVTVDLIIFGWSYYNIILNLLSLHYIFVIILLFGTLLFGIFMFGGGTKLKHRKTDIAAISTMVYPLVVINVIIMFSPIFSFISDYIGKIEFLCLFVALNIYISALTLRSLLIKLYIWFRWGDINVR